MSKIKAYAEWAKPRYGNTKLTMERARLYNQRNSNGIDSIWWMMALTVALLLIGVMQ